MSKRKKALLEADRFRETLIKLMRVADVEWTDFEDNWMRDEARRSEDYIYTKTEREILNQLIATAKTFTHYACYSVQELVAGVYTHRADLEWENEEWITDLRDSGVRELPVKLMHRLASLYRRTEPLARDEDVDEAFRATRLRDSSELSFEDID
jgi:hypothetical protein